jgi:hypothetical protein
MTNLRCPLLVVQQESRIHRLFHGATTEGFDQFRKNRIDEVCRSNISPSGKAFICIALDVALASVQQQIDEEGASVFDEEDVCLDEETAVGATALAWM